MGNIVTVYRDRRQGNAGVNGENGLGVADVRGSVVDNPILDGLNNNKIATVSDLSVSRAGEALNTDRYGNLEWIPGDTITNETKYSSTYQGQWFDFLSKWTGVTGEADPFGGTDAEEITLDAVTTGTTFDVMSNPTSLNDTGEYFTLSFYIRVKSGTVDDLDVILTWGGFQQLTIPCDVTLTSSFQRVVFRFTYPQAASFSINPRGASGAKLVLYGVQLQKGSVVTDLINTTTAPVTQNYTGDVQRDSDTGYLIENAKTNLAKDSEDLSLWTLSSGTVSTATDPFGFTNRNIKVSWSTINTVTLSHAITHTPGTTYTVSAYVNLSAGSLSSATVSIGGGSEVALDAFPTSGFTRVSAQVTSGTGTDLVFKLTSPTNNAAPIITNIQVETGGLSSYIRNGTGTNARPADIYSATYKDSAPLPSGNWTFTFTHSGIVEDSTEKNVFDNGLSSADEFRCWFVNDDLKVKNGTQTATFSSVLDSSELSLTFDGSDLKLYKGEILDSTVAFTTPSPTAGATLYVGADSAGADSINAHLANIKFFDKALTANEIKYQSGV